MEPLAPLPVTVDGRVPDGLWAGAVNSDPAGSERRRGRVRRWRYVAAGDARVVVGAAVVDLGYVGTAFAFARIGRRVATWSTLRPAARGLAIGATPAAGASADGRRVRLRIDGDGSFRIDVRTGRGRLRAEVDVVEPVTPATLRTATPAGGWNVTVKSAGSPVAGRVQLGGVDAVALGSDAGGWWDWTCGRQDRRTAWRWAAGAGTAADGRRVGVNASSRMNGAGAGEDVVWWDGTPYPLDVAVLGPTGDPASRPWRLAGPATSLTLTPLGARAADEGAGPVRSSYVQPFGTWAGTLPDPTGEHAEVRLAGVAEDHTAVW